jgi:hypothetical protein
MTLRAVVVAAALSLIGIVWIHQASLVQSPWNPYAPVYFLSVPPVPAIIFLYLLAAALPLLPGVIRVRPFSRRELALVYIILIISIPPTTFGIIELLLPWGSAAKYFGTPQNGLTDIANQYFPAWAIPRDDEAIRAMFEGSETGAIAWRAWALPLAGWTILCGLFFFAATCLVSMLHRQWSRHEHLRYPLLLLPLSVVGTGHGHAEVRGLFRNPLTWIAISLVFMHHTLNIAHQFNPAVTALMDRSYVGRLLTEWPWTAFNGLTFMHRPQMIGFSYFVSVDVLFSGWFFFVAQMAVKMIADMAGYQGAPGFPFAAQQGSGAFTAVFIALLWVGRDHLAQVFRGAIRPGSGGDEGEAMSHPLMVWGAVGGFAAIVLWCLQMKMALWVAIAYFGLMLGWAVVYGRIRAEAGLASMWAFPFVQHSAAIEAVVGTRGLMRGSDATNIVTLGLFDWMSHGYFPSLLGCVAENEKLAEEVGLPLRSIPWVMMAALGIGLAGGYWVTLRSYYSLGANVLHGAGSGMGYNVSSAMGAWNAVAGAVRQPSGPDHSQVAGMATGALVTAALYAARRTWLRFPFHPLGYAMALNYGYCLWGPFFVTWLIKLGVDKLGGATLYRRLMPFFLGLAMGDLIAGGLMWVLLALFGSEITNGYLVQFG